VVSLSASPSAADPRWPAARIPPPTACPGLKPSLWGAPASLMLPRGPASASVARPFGERSDQARNGACSGCCRYCDGTRIRVPAGGLGSARRPAVPWRGIKEGGGVGVSASRLRPPPPTPPLISAHQTPAPPHRQAASPTPPLPRRPLPSGLHSLTASQQRPAEQDAAPGAPWTLIRICGRSMSPYQTRKRFRG
jgi:hypothetical protein